MQSVTGVHGLQATKPAHSQCTADQPPVCRLQGSSMSLRQQSDHCRVQVSLQWLGCPRQRRIISVTPTVARPPVVPCDILHAIKYWFLYLICNIATLQLYTVIYSITMYHLGYIGMLRNALHSMQCIILTIYQCYTAWYILLYNQLFFICIFLYLRLS